MKVIMKYFIFVLLLSLVFCVSAVSAQDTIAFEQNNENNELTASSEFEREIKSENEESLVNNAEGNKNKVLSNSNDTDFTNIQEKINNASEGGIIYLDGKNYTGSNPIVVNKTNITIIGGSSSNPDLTATLNAEGLTGIMEIQNANVVIKGIKFINGKSSSYYSGAIQFDAENTTISSCIFINNSCEESGGAINGVGIGFKLTDSLFYNNYAQMGGGAIIISSDDALISNCNFENNTAGYWAGAAALIGDFFNLTNSNFTNNKANDTGGAVLIDGADNFVDNCIFVNNSANSCGALGWFGVNGTLTSSRFIKNRAGESAGALFWTVSISRIENNEFEGNAARIGGAIYSGEIYGNGDNVTITGNTFSNNTASSGGNTIWVDGPNNSFIDNTINSGLSNANEIYLTNASNFTYNNVDTSKIAEIQYIMDVYNLVALVNQTHQIRVAVRDSLGNILSGYVSIYASDYPYSDSDYGELLDGQVILNLTTPETPRMLDLEVLWTFNHMLGKFVDKTVPLLVVDINQLNNGTAIVTMPSNSTGTVTIKIGDKSFSGDIVNSTAKIDITGLPNGMYNAEFIYNGFDENITLTVKNSSINVVMSADDMLGIIGEELPIAITITDEYGNPLNGAIVYCICPSINYNSSEILTNGQATFKIPAQNTLKVLDLTFSFANLTKTAKYIISNITQKGNTLEIKLPSDATGNVSLKAGSKTYLQTLSNASATIIFDDLSDGKYLTTLTYSGDVKYPRVSKNITIDVKHKIPVYEIVGGDVFAIYSGNAVYRVLVTKDKKAVGAGEKVTINFNGKKTVVETDANGYATFKIDTKIKVKDYTITATYNGVDTSNTVKIGHIIKASDKKVKKSAKTSKVKISLKKVDGKTLKKAKITIKFKGKKYKVKTNKKGVATWKVKKSMLKKLKVGKKVNYTVTYGKDTLTKKLIIKK